MKWWYLKPSRSGALELAKLVEAFQLWISVSIVVGAKMDEGGIIPSPLETLRELSIRFPLVSSHIRCSSSDSCPTKSKGKQTRSKKSSLATLPATPPSSFNTATPRTKHEGVRSRHSSGNGNASIVMYYSRMEGSLANACRFGMAFPVTYMNSCLKHETKVNKVKKGQNVFRTRNFYW